MLSSVMGVNALMAQQITGKIFKDENSNGIMDARETGLSGVKVSDGRNVTTSGADGSYTLPGHTKARFVFITTPVGYKAAKQFYRRLDSTATRYDIGIVPVKKPGAPVARFVRMTDTETSLYGEWASQIKTYAHNRDADFIIHTGDICYEDGLKFHAQQLNSATMGLPVYYCIGNHDLVKGPYGEALYESLFGPVLYSFEAGPAHFIVTPMMYGDYKPSYTIEDVYEWLRNDLANTDPAKPVIIFNHDLLTYDTLFQVPSGKGDTLRLNDHNLKAWIYGHWHINYSKQHGQTGIRSYCSAPAPDGGIDNSASCFDEITIDKNGIADIQRRYTYVNNNLTLISPAANGIVPAQQQLKINVNAYHTTSPVSAVTYRLYDRNGHQLQQVSLAMQSDWNWNGWLQLPDTTAGQVYISTTEATLGTGEVLFRRDTFSTGSSSPLRWTTNVKGNIWKTAPLIAGNMVYTATLDDEMNKHCTITAMDIRTGNILWQYKTKNSIKHQLAYHNGTLLATDAEGYTYALDAVTGNIRWQHNGGQHSLPGYNSGGIVKDGVYYTGAAGYFQALDIATGKVKWTNRDWKGGEGTPASMAIYKDLLVTSSNWRDLYAHDRRTGRLRWSRNDGGIRFRSGSPLFQDGRLYVHGINRLHIINPDNGKTIDSIAVADELKTMTAPVVNDQHIILCTASAGVTAYDRITKELVWRFIPGEALFYTAPYSRPNSATVESTPVQAGGKLYFGASDGYLYVLDAAKGTLINRVKLGAPVFADVTVKDGVVYVADFSGNVSAFTL